MSLLTYLLSFFSFPVMGNKLKSPQGSHILVLDESDERTCLHQSKIMASDSYERQGESIIMWKEVCDDSGKEFDVALSFQNPAGCLSAWNLIGMLTQSSFASYPYQYGQHALRLLGDAEDMYGAARGASDGLVGFLPSFLPISHSFFLLSHTLSFNHFVFYLAELLRATPHYPNAAWPI